MLVICVLAAEFPFTSITSIGNNAQSHIGHRTHSNAAFALSGWSRFSSTYFLSAPNNLFAQHNHLNHLRKRFITVHRFSTQKITNGLFCCQYMNAFVMQSIVFIRHGSWQTG